MAHRPDHLSVSQITAFIQCARRYGFRYVDRREPERRSAALAFGSAVHGALGWWMERRMAGEVTPSEQVKRTFRADWSSELSTGLIPDDTDLSEVAARGAELVGRAVDHLAAGQVPSGLEVRFEVPLVDPRTRRELPVPLVGYFDFVEPDDVVGEIKTAARKNTPSTWALQLGGYSHAYRRVHRRPARLRLVQLLKTIEPRVEETEVQIGDREEAWFNEVAADVYDAITLGARYPNPSWQCPSCEYRKACRGR